MGGKDFRLDGNRPRSTRRCEKEGTHLDPQFHPPLLLKHGILTSPEKVLMRRIVNFRYQSGQMRWTGPVMSGNLFKSHFLRVAGHLSELKWLHHEMHLKTYSARTNQINLKRIKPQRCDQQIYVYYVCHPGAYTGLPYQSFSPLKIFYWSNYLFGHFTDKSRRSRGFLRKPGRA